MVVLFGAVARVEAFDFNRAYRCESVLDECLFDTEAIKLTDEIPLDHDLTEANHRLGAALMPEIKPVVAAVVVKREVTVPDAGELMEFFVEAERTYGVPADKLARIAHCESGFRADAVGGGGLYWGLFQFVSGTWVSNRKAMGADPDPRLRLDARENIMTAAFKMSRDGYGAWPVCGKK